MVKLNKKSEHKKAVNTNENNIKELKLLAIQKIMLLEINVLQWGKYYFPDKFTLPFCEELHQYFVDIRKDPFTDTLAPRGYAKTTIRCFLIPLYMALVEPEEFRFYLNIQSTSAKAININLAIKNELEHNKQLIQDYGNQVSEEKWTEKLLVLNNGVIFSAIGAGESIRGINYRNIRPDYIIVDDLYDDEDIHNPDRIRKKEDWFWQSVYNCKATGRKVCMHIQGTAINRSDLMHVLKDRKGITYRKFQAVKDWDTEEILWKENETFNELMELKDKIGSIIFTREKQNDCRDDETAIIRESWIQYYNGELPSNEKIIANICSLDPAIGQKNTNDYSAFCQAFYTDHHNYYIVDCFQERLSFDAILRQCKNWNTRKTPTKFRIEGISAFIAIVTELQRTSNVPVEALTSVPDKISRLEAQSSKFENGKVFINSNIPDKYRNTLVEQLINNNPPHDDMRDSCVMCLEYEKRAITDIVLNNDYRDSIWD